MTAPEFSKKAGFPITTSPRDYGQPAIDAATVRMEQHSVSFVPKWYVIFFHWLGEKLGIK